VSRTPPRACYSVNFKLVESRMPHQDSLAVRWQVKVSLLVLDCETVNIHLGGSD
jgi:hypothetical protein